MNMIAPDFPSTIAVSRFSFLMPVSLDMTSGNESFQLPGLSSLRVLKEETTSFLVLQKQLANWTLLA